MNGMKTVGICLVVVVVLIVLCSPMLFPSYFPSDLVQADWQQPFGRRFLLLIPAAAIFFCYRQETGPFRVVLSRILLLLVISLILESIHYTTVDQGRYFFPMVNEDWQEDQHKKILRFDPQIIPHSYRFLADTTVRVLESFSGSFDYAKSIYRHTTMFLLVYSIYAFARIFVLDLGAVITVLLYSLIYPVSIRYYAGQLIDPLSHLSFVCCFIFGYRRQPLYFALAMLTGCLAKESVLAMAIFYWIANRSQKNALLHSALMLVLGLALVMAVRLYVNSGAFAFGQVSGVPKDWASTNLSSHGWEKQIAFTVGIFLPFVALEWRWTHSYLKALILYLLPILLVSNLFFSWLQETRNLVPVAIPLAIVTAQLLIKISQPTKESSAAA